MNLYFWPMERIDGVYLLIGTNLGNRMQNLRMAVRKISEQGEVIKCVSSVYETAAWGETNQPDFYNIALELESARSPLDLLKLLQTIEAEMGRIRIRRWEERIIDIDILYYSNQVVSLPELAIPHPEIQNRRFALEPLNEIAANFSHPVLNETNKSLLLACEDELDVKNLGKFTYN